MRIIRILTLAVVMIGLFTGVVRASPAAGAAQPVLPGTDQVMVTFADELVSPAGVVVERRALLLSAAARLSAGAGVELAYLRETGGGAAVLKLDQTLPDGEVQALTDHLAGQPGVLRAEPDWIVQPAVMPMPAVAASALVAPALDPNDVFWSDLWGLAPYQSTVQPAGALVVANGGIDAPAAWSVTYGDPNVLVAVIDTGILKNHEDLQNRYVGGYDFVSKDLEGDGDGGWDADASDPGNYCGEGASNWHGSHVAGTIGASGGNSTGVTGINWYSRILPVRVMGRCGGYLSDVIAGMYYAVGASLNGMAIPPNPYAGQVKVLNLSLGAPKACTGYMQDAVNAATARGVVVVTAAGNDERDASLYMPGSCNGVITVGASTQNGSRAAYSNFGSLVELSAPGGQIGDPTHPAANDDSGIYSTVDMGYTDPVGSYYRWMHGTSMASPHVAGIVSLMFSAYPRLTNDQALMILKATASPFSPASPCSASSVCGAGIANAGRAVQDAASFYWIEWPTKQGRYGSANAGDVAAPRSFTIITAAAANPKKTTVKIDGVEATVQSVTSGSGRDYLTVLPGAMFKNGRYDLEVTIDGAPHVQPQSVYFGMKTFLPAIVR